MRLETRTKITSAAKELFIKKGFKGTSTRQIAEKAGISEMTLFRHFPTKDTVFNAVVQPLIDFLDNLEFKEQDELKLQIKELLQDRLSFLCEERDLVRFVIMESYLSTERINPISQAADKIRNLLSSFDVSKRELYLRLIMGYILTWIFLPEKCEGSPDLEQIIDLLQ